MPKVRWGVSARDIDDFDRDSQYKPYDGPVPQNGVYEWQIKKLQYIAGTRDKHPQLRIGLKLAPRDSRKEEKRYAGYFLMAFIPIMEKTAFRYVPFLDAIGVSGRDFEARTIADEEGNIKKIGQWRNTGEEFISAEIKDGKDGEGNPRKEIGWMGPLVESEDEDEPEEDEEFEEEDEEVPF